MSSNFLEELRQPQGGTAKENRETPKASSDFIKNHYGLEAEEWQKLLKNDTLDYIERIAGMKSVQSTSSTEQQLKKLEDYLGDTISEFVSSDDGVSPHDFVGALKKVLSTEYDYYQRQADKNKKILNLLNYNVN